MELNDTYIVFEILTLLAGFLGAFILKSITTAVKEIEKKMTEMPMTYVLKEDYHKDIDDIKDMLREIFNDLKQKQDRRRDA